MPLKKWEGDRNFRVVGVVLLYSLGCMGMMLMVRLRRLLDIGEGRGSDFFLFLDIQRGDFRDFLQVPEITL